MLRASSWRRPEDSVSAVVQRCRTLASENDGTQTAVLEGTRELLAALEPAMAGSPAVRRCVLAELLGSGEWTTRTEELCVDVFVRWLALWNGLILEAAGALLRDAAPGKGQGCQPPPGADGRPTQWALAAGTQPTAEPSPSECVRDCGLHEH
jgi:hypothetical protein